MVLPGGFAVLSLLPAVAVAPVADLLPRVQQHGAALRSVQLQAFHSISSMNIIGAAQWWPVAALIGNESFLGIELIDPLDQSSRISEKVNVSQKPLPDSRKLNRFQTGARAIHFLRKFSPPPPPSSSPLQKLISNTSTDSDSEDE